MNLIGAMPMPHLFHFTSKLIRCSCDLETKIWFSPSQFVRCFNQNWKNLAHLAGAASREKSDQAWIAFDVDLGGAQSFDHGMPDKNRAQARLVIEIGFERENAEHEIEKARHLFDSSTVPGPNLRTDEVDDLVRRHP